MKVLEVVGLTFVPGYPDNLHRLHYSLKLNQARRSLKLNQARIRWVGNEDDGYSTPAESFPVQLIPDPANPHDPNAVEVHIPSLGNRVGYLGRHHAAIVSPFLQDRANWLTQAWVYRVRIDPDHPNQPGLDIAINRFSIAEHLINQQNRKTR